MITSNHLASRKSNLNINNRKKISDYFLLLRCKIGLHKKISDVVGMMKFKVSYKVITQLYLTMYTQNKLEETLDLLASEENDFVEKWEQFRSTAEHSEIVSSFFSDLNEAETEKSKLVGRAIKAAKPSTKAVGIEIKKVVDLAESSGNISWSSLETLLSQFSSVILTKTINRPSGKESKLENIRLDAMINLCLVFNILGIYEPSYAGDSMLDEFKKTIYCQDENELIKLTLRMKSIRESD